MTKLPTTNSTPFFPILPNNRTVTYLEINSTRKTIGNSFQPRVRNVHMRWETRMHGVQLLVVYGISFQLKVACAWLKRITVDVTIVIRR